MENCENIDDNADGWDDPLAVKVGLGMETEGDIPADGYPKTFHPEIIARILSYLPE